MKPFWLLLLLLIIPGCIKVGPDFSPPCVPEQEYWRGCSEGEITEDPCSIEQWWTLFDDPLLEELIDLALAQNLSLKVAAMRILEARALQGIAVGEFFPQTQELTGDVTHLKVAKNAPNSRFLDRKYWDLQLGFLVSWELDIWGKFRRNIEAATEDLSAEVADFEDFLVLLLGDVASTYVAIRTNEERIEIVKYNIAIQERSLQIVKARWNAGMVTELDVSQAQTLLSSTQARLPVLEADLDNSKHALATLLGIPPLEVDCYLQTSGKIPTAPRSIAAGIPCELLIRRPDVRRAYHVAAAQSARIGIAAADLYPSFSLSGFFGLNSSEDASRRTTEGNRKFFNPDSYTYTYGGGFSWPILNYGRLMNRVRAQSAVFCQALLAYQNSVLFAYQEVEDALSNFFNSMQQVEALKVSVKAANRAVELSRTQYVEGIADYTRVLNTEEALVEQEEELAIARGNIALSLISAYRALGGGWQSVECALD